MITIPELENLIQNRMKHGIKRIAISCDELQKLIDVARVSKKYLYNACKFDEAREIIESLTWEKPKKEKYVESDGPRVWK
jgi:hypothetical protein